MVMRGRFWRVPGVTVLFLMALFWQSLTISSLVFAATAQPGITLTSDSENIYLGDTIVLEVEAVGILGTLDISPLFRHADLIRETTGTRIAVIEERVVEVKLRRMEFLPRREGRLLLGPLQGDSTDGAVVSNTLAINVAPAIDTQWQPDESDLAIDVHLTSKLKSFDGLAQSSDFNAYVGQQIIVDIELRHQFPIAEEIIVLPSFAGFDVLPEYEEKRTLDNNTDKNTRLISWRYHLFAKRSGAIKLEPVQWSGTEIKSRTQRASFERQSKKTSIAIEPALHRSSWWLPASSVSISDQWSKDARELSAGDEIIRTITLSAENVLASHLPRIQPLESRAISSTLIKQTRHQQLINQQINASAEFTFRLVAQSPIPVFLDTVRVPWFDITSNTAREAIIPARRINVGLPDRADLLAELATSHSWLNRLTLRLRSQSQGFAFWHISLVALACLFLVLISCEVHHVFKKNQSGNAIKSHLPEL